MKSFRVLLVLSGIVSVRAGTVKAAPQYGAVNSGCEKVLIPIDNTHKCDVGIPTCTECPGKKIEYLACNDCKCGDTKTDCVWNDWGVWGKCSMGALVDGDCMDCPDCCNGVKMRERTIKTPAECGGMPCNGSDKEIEACGQDCKPPGCSWETWGDWSSCSKQCGGGQKYRKRKMVGSKTTTCCNKDLAICDGPSIEWCGCNTQCCTGTSGCLCADGGCDCGVCMKGQHTGKPVDCDWDNWSDWLGNCKSKNCGAPGALTRTREIKTFALDGGKPCCGESREVKPCGGDNCGHDCKYGDWTDWSGCTESCGGGQKYRHRDITFEPNKQDRGGKPCAPKQDVLCPASCYVAQNVNLAGEGACPCIEKKTTTITCKAPKVGSVGTTEVSETAGCNLGDCKCYWKDWTEWTGCSKKCGGGYKVRCKEQGCASEAVAGVKDYGDAKLKAALDPCDPGNKAKLPDCGASGWCAADEWGEATCECDTGKFFIQDMNEKTKVKGVCVTKDSFDTFMSDKFSVESEVVQPVKMSGLVGLQVNDAESVLTETAQKMLNVPTVDVRAYYKDDAHLQDEESTNMHPQKMFLQDAPARFEINVQCTSRGQGCSLVQMELLQALRDKKTEFNTQFRKSSGKETAYVAANGLPAVLTLSEDVDGLAASSHAVSRKETNTYSGFLALIAGVAMTTLGFVTFLKLKKRQMNDNNARTPVQEM